MMRHTKADNAKARELFERAASLDPEYSRVFTALGWTHCEDAHHGWSESRGESLLRAVELAKKALALDDSDPMIHACGELSTCGKGGMTRPLPRGRRPSPSVPTRLYLTFCWRCSCTIPAGIRRRSRC